MPLVMRVGVLLAVLCVTGLLVGARIEWERFAAAGYLGVFAANLLGSSAIVAQVPVGIVIVAAGRVLNPLLVAGVSGTGSALGEFSAYAVGLVGTGVVERHRERLQKPLCWVDRWGALAIFALAAAPTPFYDLAGIAAGMVRMNAVAFFLATLVGRFAKAYVLASAGHLLFGQVAL